MKKVLAAVVFIFTVLIMSAGCVADGVNSYSDTCFTIEVKAGGEFIITLDSNPTTGYSWKASYDEAQFELVSDNYEQDETEEMMTGVGGTQYLRFKALKAGNFEITLDYQRSWEDEAIEQKVFSVSVS
jgi:predicted secreted protein